MASKMRQIAVKLSAFEGPFDLLFHLIDANEINLYDIPIASLTDQYLEYIAEFPADIDSMSEFALMAATLIEIKSKMLLPSLPTKNDDEKEEDPRAELVRRLVEYKVYKVAAEVFADKRALAENLFYRPDMAAIEPIADTDSSDSDKPDLSSLLSGVSPSILFRAFEEALARRAMRVDTIRSDFNSVTRDSFTIADKIDEIVLLLRTRKEFTFVEIFRENAEKDEMIASFLALLELIKLQRIIVTQYTAFGEIYIKSIIND